jgi:replication factor C small subunit
VFRFKLLEKKDVSTVLKKIAEKENLKLADDAFNALYEASEGDCRRAINLLQATASISPDINAEMINIISAKTKPANIKVVLDYALVGDFINA